MNGHKHDKHIHRNKLHAHKLEHCVHLIRLLQIKLVLIMFYIATHCVRSHFLCWPCEFNFPQNNKRYHIVGYCIITPSKVVAESNDIYYKNTIIVLA